MVEPLGKNKYKIKKRRFHPPPGESQSAKTCFFGMVTQMSTYLTKNEHEWGAIWSNRDETLSSDIAMMRSIFWEGWGLGAGALGKS